MDPFYSSPRDTPCQQACERGEPAATAPFKTRRQRGTAKPAAAKTRTLSLGDATLRAIAALGNGASAEDVRNYLGQELGMEVRRNHLVWH